jgi:hypothetical protein
VLGSPSRRPRSAFIVFEVTILAIDEKKHVRPKWQSGGVPQAEMSTSAKGHLALIYTIYGLLSIISGLGVRHTSPAGRAVGITGYGS